MTAMGRRRTKDLDLPPRMRRVGDAYYYDTQQKPRKWIALGSDKIQALRLWAEHEGKHGELRTVGAALDRYLALYSKGLAAESLRAYSRAAKVLKKYFGTAPLDAVRVEHLAEYRDRNQRKAAGNMQLMLLGLVYQRAKEWGWCSTNPAVETRRNTLAARKRYLTHQEYATLWDASRPLVRAVMDLSYLTGMRQSDVLKLRLADLRDDGIYVEQKKTGKRQLFQWSPELRAAVDAARALPKPIGSLYLICDRRGSPYIQKAFQRRWTLDWGKTGIEDAHMHDVRAKAATDADGEGRDVQKLLGHASPAMSARYVRLRRAEIVEPLQKPPRKSLK
jgi:integrase